MQCVCSTHMSSAQCCLYLHVLYIEWTDREGSKVKTHVRNRPTVMTNAADVNAPDYTLQ